MNRDQEQTTSIDEYIASFPDEVAAILRRVRTTIREAAPEAEEAIRYRIPTFVGHGNIVHFAAFPRHLGFYPTPSGIDAFREELGAYELSKGTVRFPLEQPIPFDLIARITRLRVEQDRETAARKRRKGPDRV